MKKLHLIGNGIVKVGNTYMTVGEYKLSRRTDPATSKAAARKLIKSGKHKSHCDIIYSTLKRFKKGANANQISASCGMEKHGVYKRLNDLRNDGLVFKTLEVRDGQTVWKVANAQQKPV